MILKDQFAEFEKRLAEVARLAAEVPDEDGLYNKLIAHAQKLAEECKQALKEVPEPVRTEDIEEEEEEAAPKAAVPVPPFQVGDPLQQDKIRRAIDLLLGDHLSLKPKQEIVSDESISSEWEINLGQAPQSIHAENRKPAKPVKQPKPARETVGDESVGTDWTDSISEP